MRSSLYLLAALFSAGVVAGTAGAQSAESTPTRFQSYRTPLEATVVDRRFTTREAMYLATEMNIGGDPFFKNAMLAGLPVADDGDFMYMTAVESYWYSRYNMSALVTESRLGVHLVHGPYVSERAVLEGRAIDNRDRGEYVLSNKSEFLQRIIPAFLSVTGFPRRFEDASPTMLQFASGDPHYTRPLDTGTDFESPENLERQRELARLYGDREEHPRGAGKGGNELWRYRVNYRENFLTLRWSNDRMDHTIDLGAEGQTLLKQVLWSEYFFQSNHHGGMYLGNNSEEGFRGATLTLMEVSKMLMLKSSLVYDGKRLGGFNPIGYDPSQGLRYFPHQVSVRLRLVGDIPPRPEEFSVKDRSSQLFDQASLLWALSEYYFYSDPTMSGARNEEDYYESPAVRASWRRVFGTNPPYDGTVLERKYGLLAQALANLVLENIEAMHERAGVLVSEWTPERGVGATVHVQDAALATLALATYHRRLHVETTRRERAAALLRREADFFVDRLQRSDGSVADGYDFTAGETLGVAPTLLAQGMAVRALLKAYQELGDERYRDAAVRVYNYMNSALWDEELGIYRSSAGAEKTVYTPMNLGAALGAVREIILVSKNAAEISRFKRFWVQGVDSSGIQQSEYEETGEHDLDQCDGDRDGIPRMEYAGGRYGIAPVFASRVEIQTPVRVELSGR